MAGNSPPPGWYTDGQGGQRWWDGSKWYEAVEPATEPAAPVGEHLVQHDSPARPTESGSDPPSTQRIDPSVEAGQRRKTTKPSLPPVRVLGSAIAIAGIALAIVATVLLFMVNPDCLNNENCQLSQSYWDLFGIKSSALLAGLLLVGVGLFVRRRAAPSAGLTLETTGPETSKGIATTLRRKRVWIPVAAVTLLALAAGSWAVVTAGPSDEEKRIASEKSASAAAAEAERQAEEELAQSKATCESAVGEFKEAVEAVNSKLNVGLVQSDFGNAVGDASVAHNSLDVDAISDDLYCLSKVAQPLEQAFNIYVRTNNKWNKCITNYGCEVKGALLKDMQGKWLKATLKITAADQALENYESEAASV